MEKGSQNSTSETSAAFDEESSPLYEKTRERPRFEDETLNTSTSGSSPSISQKLDTGISMFYELDIVKPIVTLQFTNFYFSKKNG
jgi:hypothetical protein